MRYLALLLVLLGSQLTGLTVAAAREHAADAAIRQAISPSDSAVQWPAVDRGLSKQREVPEAKLTMAGGSKRSLQQSGNGRVVAWGKMVIQNYVPDLVGQATDVAIVGETLTDGVPFVRDPANAFLALLANQSVVKWGGATGGIIMPANATANVTAIAAGSRSALALLSHGAVVPLNDASDVFLNSQAQLDVPEMAQAGVDAIWAGLNWHFARLGNGSVVAWDALGTVEVLKPSSSTGMVVNVAVSWTFGSICWITLRANGSVIPEHGVSVVPNVLQTNVTAIVGTGTWGGASFLALLRNGSIVQWSYVSPDQLGAVRFPFNSTDNIFTSIAAPSYAVTALGAMVSWDLHNPTDTSSTLPTSVQNGVRSVASGVDMSLALLQPGPFNVVGFKGAAKVPATSSVPAGVSTAIATQVAAGRAHAIALQTDGSVMVWGDNSKGQLSKPQDLESVGVKQVAAHAASDYCMAVTRQGHLFGWGGIEIPVEAQFNVAKVAAGRDYSLAVLRNGSVVGWGTAEIAHTIPDAARVNVLDVAAGDGFAVAVLTNGSIIQWGLNHTTPKLEGVVSVAAGSVFAAAVLNNSNLVFWQVRPTGTLWFNPPSFMQGLHAQDVLLALAPSLPGALSVGTEYGLVLLDNNTLISVPYLCDNGTYRCPAITIPPNAQSGVIDMAIGGGFFLAVTTSSTSATPAGVTPSVPQVAPGTPTQPQSPVPSPVLPSPQAPQGVASVGASPSSSKKISKGAVAGITVGCVIAVAAVVALAVVMYRHWSGQKHSAAAGGTRGFEGVAIPAESVKISGLPEGELFVLATARNYVWTLSTALQGPVTAVEAGVNDTQLDKMLQQQVKAQQAAAALHCPAVQLSKDELCQQVQLLSDGLLGRGATALVFKCVWPSRFGPNALLAAKVLHNGFESDMTVLSSFAYEANLLAGIQHPHVVKLYGYCLEPPTVCLILELLPCSLKDVLYKSPPNAVDSQAASSTASWPDFLSRHCVRTPLLSVNCAPTASTNVSCAAPKSAGVSSDVTSEEGPTASGTASSSNSNGLPMQSIAPVEGVCPYSDSMPSYGVPPPTSPSSQAQPGSSVNRSTMCPAAVDGDGTADVKVNGSMASKHSIYLLKPVTLLQIVRLCTDIAAGLAHLHSQPATPATVNGGERQLQLMATRDGRIVHRDIKPANILLSSQGVAKISDFGLARQHDHTTFATINLGAGTLPYMAPELLISSKAGVSGAACTNRVDIYSLGIIMWELLMGQPPWKGMSAASIMAAVINRRRLPLPIDVQSEDREHAIMDMPQLQSMPAHTHPDMPKMCQIIQACWQNRELRRPTAAALHGTLSALLQQLEQQPSSTKA